MEHGYKTEVIRLEGGERFPLLLSRNTMMPVGSVCDYSLTYHRGKPINSSKPHVDALGLFYTWSSKRGISLDERFHSGNLFTTDEITSLSEELWVRRSIGKSANSAPTRVVIGETHGNRIDAVIAYIKWRISVVYLE